MKKLILSALIMVFFLAGCAAEEPVSFSDNESQLLSKGHVFPEMILLPDGFEPEGIVSGRGTTFYVGSLATGEIYQGDYRTGEGSILVAASSRPAFGLSYDSRTNYIYAAGGPTGFLYVYDASTGELAAQHNVPGAMFINDVVVTRTGVYMSESLGPVIYKLPLTPNGMPSGGVMVIALTGEYEFVPNAPTPFGINNNGIETAPNGKYLFVNNMADGKLYRVNSETGFAYEVDLGGVELSWGDGLLLTGHTIYVVQNFLNQISEIKLGPDYLSGTLTEVITHPAFEIPTTVALSGNSLYVVNARFDMPPGPFYVVKVGK